ncbi:MAG: hypothetical protein NWQ25_00590, partial [Prochlorococcaceae cyanobacterium MAG_34]|nr:hypothetical protein [Prochlorococcaceae cyanobacterium MAG_34]
MSESVSRLSIPLEEWLWNWALNGRLSRAAEEALGLNGENLAWLKLLAALEEGDLSLLPPLEFQSSLNLGGATGAYDSTNDRILINADWAAQATEAELQAVFAEELGHWLDARFNGSDTAGDEGQLFAAVLLEQPLSDEQLEAIQSEDDSRSLFLDGQTIQVEQQRVYET